MGDARGKRIDVRIDEMKGRCVCHDMVGRGRTGRGENGTLCVCVLCVCVCVCVEQCNAYTPVLPWNI